jgi:hypothetical protein
MTKGSSGQTGIRIRVYTRIAEFKAISRPMGFLILHEGCGKLGSADWRAACHKLN